MAKLKEVIEQAQGNYGLKIGTEHGAGFMWCGLVSEIKGNYGIMDKRAKQKHKERIKGAKQRLNKLFTECPTIGKYAQQNYRRDEPFGSVEGYLESLKDYFAELEKAKGRLLSAESKAERYVQFAEREVVTLYKSIAEKSTAIIIVEGNESGDAWDTEEFKSLKGQGYEGRQAEETED